MLYRQVSLNISVNVSVNKYINKRHRQTNIYMKRELKERVKLKLKKVKEKDKKGEVDFTYHYVSTHWLPIRVVEHIIPWVLSNFYTIIFKFFGQINCDF